MKLELKHLSPYLPYELKIQVRAYPDPIQSYNKGNKGKLISIDLTGISYSHTNKIWKASGYSFESIKPILRPLSDLTSGVCIRMFKEVHGSRDDISCNDSRKKRFVHWSNDEFGVEGIMRILDKMGRLCRMSKDEFEWLYKNHYDLDGLIPEGLALDINTLNGQD